MRVWKKCSWSSHRRVTVAAVTFVPLCFWIYTPLWCFVCCPPHSAPPSLPRFCSRPPDEQREAVAPSPQPHPLPPAVRGAGEQPAPGHPGRQRSLRWSEEEPLVWLPTGAGAAAGELYERRLPKRPVVRLWSELSLQGEPFIPTSASTTTMEEKKNNSYFAGGRGLTSKQCLSECFTHTHTHTWLQLECFQREWHYWNTLDPSLP